jgi:N4-(beta-N-acetylglucosaminyl)-L-asparaginase
MVDRRKFLKTSSLAGAALFAGEHLLAGNGPGLPPRLDNPIVISTWDFGVEANLAAWDTLKNGGRALDAVEKGVHVPEADPEVHSVGLGGFPDRDGKVTLDACIMDEFGNCGSVAALQNIVHPISVARLVMEKTPHVLLVGEGALKFALEQGFKEENILTRRSEREWQQWLKKSEYKPEINVENKPFRPDRLPGNKFNHDTIGMLAIDSRGNLSGACTTSGMAFKMHGRVGDSPIIGAGLYVDNEIGAATSTGVGEEVIRNVGSFLVVELMRQAYPPEEACKEAVMRIIKKKPDTAKNIQVGFLALNRQGQYGAYSIQKGFSFAVCDKLDQALLIKGKSYY